MGKKADLTGHVFGRLTAMKPVGMRGHNVVWECQCSCGNLTNVPVAWLKSGNTKSCGCEVKSPLQVMLEEQYGGSWLKSPEHMAFNRARLSCTSPKSGDWKTAGALGIKFNFNSFEEFFEEVGLKPSGKPREVYLRRIDRMKDFEKDNVAWVTTSEVPHAGRVPQTAEELSKYVLKLLLRAHGEMSLSDLQYRSTRKWDKDMFLAVLKELEEQNAIEQFEGGAEDMRMVGLVGRTKPAVEDLVEVEPLKTPKGAFTKQEPTSEMLIEHILHRLEISGGELKHHELKGRINGRRWNPFVYKATLQQLQDNGLIRVYEKEVLVASPNNNRLGEVHLGRRKSKYVRLVRTGELNVDNNVNTK
jgi:hypothetical protein